MSSLKRKDPSIYHQSTKFFEEDNVDADISEPKKKEKKLTIKQYEQDILMKNGGAFDEEDNDIERPQSPTYNEEQQMIKDEILKIGKINDSEDEDDDDIGGLFNKREKNQKEQVRVRQKSHLKKKMNF